MIRFPYSYNVVLIYIIWYILTFRQHKHPSRLSFILHSSNTTHPMKNVIMYTNNITTPIEAYKQVFFKAGRTDNPPIPNAKQSVSEVMNMEPPACLTAFPNHSANSNLQYM